MFIIDLDDTLLDTQAFKQARVHVLRSLGVSEELYQQSYREAFRDVSGNNIYNSFTHAVALAKYGFDKEKVLRVLQGTEAGLKNLLFDGVDNLFDFLKSTGEKIILLSLGEESFQKMKMQQTGLAKYFDLIFTVNDAKEHVIKKIIHDFPDEQTVWFINDKIEETKRLKQLFLILKPVLKVSRAFQEQEYKESRMPYFKTLIEVQQYVREQYAK